MEKKERKGSKIITYFVGLIIASMVMVFVGIVTYIDYLVFNFSEDLEKRIMEQNPDLVTVVNLNSESFLDWFIAYQLPVVVVGVLALILGIMFIQRVLSWIIRPVINEVTKKRRKAWKEYLENGFTYKDLTEEQLKGMNLRIKAEEHDLYYVSALFSGLVFVIGIIFGFLNFNNVGTEYDNTLSVIALFILAFGLLLFSLIGKNRKKPLFSIERKIKGDKEMQELVKKWEQEEKYGTTEPAGTD
ncbi:MAG: hypothetical protein ACW99A_02860 [Candidatus Kariarchaeaceae archaeon]|jgi:hypothetical protein